jgi:superfamily II DNA or RNA helicase
MFTPHQSAYFAHWLTQSGKVENQVSKVIASARVDMNPHQIDAARFALKSPLERGVLLADEVGLGKTIEASLVIAQKWAEGKRSILLVVPASLRKQWNQELWDKFELPSTVIDSKIAADFKKQGFSNPFEQQDKIIICSYEYLAQKKEYSLRLDWDLVIFDEAHKLRNLYSKSGSKRAKSVVEATEHAQHRVLLSATPLQNNLMELYGLSQVIDPHFFGDEKSFKALYVNRKKNSDALEDLKERIETLCHRTLRRQVQQEGGINFTNRYSITQDFTPLPEEWDLYQQLSAYLQNPENQAIAPNAKHLVSIGLRKILASSSFAISDTLKGMVKRLREKQQVSEDSISDIDTADDWHDIDFEEFVNSTQATNRLEYEIEQLNSFQKLAESIEVNAKGEALLLVLRRAMESTESMGGQRKAVVFTESCRTQIYLNNLLEKNGYKGRTVLLNGSNNDPQSQAIYKDWIEKHKDSSRISGSKPSDMKAALVERFKSDDADILISTEAGGEGINLQFCSLLINYDLPWNPQKVEQRIGRVHRYGQKNDVVVVNFVNRKNPADQRVFQLLNEKLKLFEGVFGASDEVLGAISENLDIEKRIYEIYQKCRTDQEIEQQFNKLQDDLKDALEVREEATRQTLLNHFDRDVVANLKNQRDKNKIFLQDYERVLLDLAKAELPEAVFVDNHFQYKGKRFDIRWSLAEQNDSEFFRLQAMEHYLAWELVKKAKARQLEPTHLTFSYNQLEGRYGALQPYIGQSGFIQVVKLVFSYNQGKEKDHKLFALAYTDNGQPDEGQGLTNENAEHLLCIPATAEPFADELPKQAFATQLEQLLESQTLAKADELDQLYEVEENKLDRWKKDREASYQITVDELNNDIDLFKKETRKLASTREKIEAKKTLRKLERKRDDAMTAFHEARKRIEKEEDEMIDSISAKLELSCQTDIIFTARWTLNA